MNMNFEEVISALGIVGGLVMSILGVIITFDKVLDILKKRNPNREMAERLDKHDELLKRDHEHLMEHDKDIKKLNSDFSSLIADIQADNAVIKKLLFKMFDGMTGEATKEDLKEAKAELLEHISK